MDSIDRNAIETISTHDRERWLGEWDGAPADRLLDVVHQLGFSVEQCYLGKKQGSIDLVRRTIYLNTNLPNLAIEGSCLQGIRFWTIAHELGHWRLHRGDLRKGRFLTQHHEREAHYYAGAFLAPREYLEMELEVEELRRYRSRKTWVPDRRVWDLCRHLGERYRLSPSAMRVRLNQLDLVSYHDPLHRRPKPAPTQRVTKPINAISALSPEDAVAKLKSRMG